MFFKVFAISCVLSLNIFTFVASENSNTCTTWIDYFIINFSKNCYYNPDVFATTHKILERRVGKYENHTVTTEDGYILRIFRLPRNNAKKVVILQHPVVTDSNFYVDQGNESLAFLLSNLGYDVWLPNHRGTYYSNKHISLSDDDDEFWKFSFHEIGLYDYPAIINYIKNIRNGSDLIFVGHSMATTASFIYSSLRPEEARQSIKMFVLMSPTATFRYMTSPIKYMAKIDFVIADLLRTVGIRVLFKGQIFRRIQELGVFLPIKIQVLLFNMLLGWTLEFDPKLVNVLTANIFRATAFKILHHYAQFMNDEEKSFKEYDYGEKVNFQVYNSSKPSEYPLGNIKVPMFFIAGEKDTLTTVEDSENVYNKLSKKVKHGFLLAKGFNHGDFLWGKSRLKKVFHPIFSLLKKI